MVSFKTWKENVRMLFKIRTFVLIFIWIPLFCIYWITDKIVDFNHYIADKANKVDVWMARH